MSTFPLQVSVNTYKYLCVCLPAPTGKWDFQAFITSFDLGEPVATLQFLTQNYKDQRMLRCLKWKKKKNLSVDKYERFLLTFTLSAITKQHTFFKLAQASPLCLYLIITLESEISSLCYTSCLGFDLGPYLLSRGTEQRIWEVEFSFTRGFLISFRTLSTREGRRPDITTLCGKS